MGVRYADSIRQHVQLLRDAGHTKNEISRRTGIPISTLHRWFNPAYNERQLVKSRERKQRLKRKCSECGKSIWMTSTKCADCARPPRKWTQEAVIKAMQDWAANHNGVPPTTRDWWTSTDEHPGATTVYGQGGLFPSWVTAIKLAGFNPTGQRASNPGPGRISWDVEQATRMRRQGLSDVEIGRRLGISAGAIQEKLGPRGKINVKSRKNRSREQRIADLRKAIQYQEGEH